MTEISELGLPRRIIEGPPTSLVPSDPTVPVKIKRKPGVPMPAYATDGSAGFDLAAAEDVIIEPGATVIVPTGLSVELPAGYELQIRPRSGISAKTKLRVQLGTVDSDFRGEIGVIVDNIDVNIFETSDPYPLGIDGGELPRQGDEYMVGTYIIHAGDRIAQAVIAPVYRAVFEEVDELAPTERGAGGFGHTGTQTKEEGE